MMRVLLIDDHVLTRESIALALRNQDGVEICESPSVEGGLAVLLEQGVDVIVLKHNLGGDSLRNAISHLNQRVLVSKVVVTADWLSNLNRRWLMKVGIGGLVTTHGGLKNLITATHCVAEGGTWYGDACPISTDTCHRGQSPVSFSTQEKRVAALVWDGMSNKEIAGAIGISESYVKAVLQRLFLKTRVRTRGQLVRVLMEERVTPVAAHDAGTGIITYA